MRESNCDKCRELLPELALGLATGEDRGIAVVHLQSCRRCRDQLAALTWVHDQLRGLIPPRDPPAGFEAKVLARVQRARGADWWAARRRRPLVASATALAVLAATFVGGWCLGTSSASPAVPAGTHTVLTARLRPTAPTGPAPGEGTAELGEVFLDPGPPAWIYLYLDTPAHHGVLTCTVLRTDGSVAASAPLPVTGEDAYWGGPIPGERTGQAAVSEIRVTDDTGATLVVARLPDA